MTLTACPPGVTGTEPPYYVYIAATGTAEAVLVTGGTCAGNGASRDVAIHDVKRARRGVHRGERVGRACRRR